MTQEHPITPPPELVDQWECEYHHMTYGPDLSIFISEKAARWGADQELEACLDQIYKGVGMRLVPYGSHRELLCSDLRAARRPNPPSLKEQALEELYAAERSRTVDYSLIRRALESLPD